MILLWHYAVTMPICQAADSLGEKFHKDAEVARMRECGRA